MLSFGTAEEIVRESFGAEAIEAYRETMLLPASPPAFEQLPPRVLVMLFSSRTGSTFAGRLLAGAPCFNKVRGAFHPRNLAEYRKRRGLADDAAAARERVAHDATEIAFGAKCGPAGIAGALYTGFLHSAHERISFITLRRRDAVAQGVSIVRALWSGRYSSRQAAGLEVDVDDYDRSAIADQIALVERMNADFDAFARRMSKENSVYFYEDVCEDPTGFVNSVLRRLGLPEVTAISTDVGLEVLRDDMSHQWRERYEAGR